MKKWLLLLLVPTLSLATIEPQQFDNPQQEADYRALIQELRCPQCQNNNIADSNATIAEDMRYKSLELLKQGKNKEEVIHYMVERYGNFVTYDPPITPATIFLWLMPLLLISIGILIMANRRKLAIQTKNASPKTATNLDHTRLQQILNNQDDKDTQ